jgi:hypothetical protein
MDKLEGLIADLAMAVKANPKRETCGNFEKTCTGAYGDKCKFEHSGHQPFTAAINVIGTARAYRTPTASHS